MKQSKILSIILFIFLGLLLTHPAYSGDKIQEKGPLHYLVTFEGKDKILGALNDPVKMIQTPILQALNKKKGISINKGSMLKTDKCIHELLTTTAHLSKISTGNKIVKIEIEINSDSRRSSMFASKKKQTLEYTELEITFFYNNKSVEPTVISCSGHRYY